MNPATKKGMLLFCLITLIFWHPQAHAQEGAKTYRIYGLVVDSVTQKPAEAATVQLLEASGRTVGTAATRNGAFSFWGLQPMAYQVQITAVGYGSKTVAVTLATGQALAVNLGFISLGRVDGQMGEVVVRAVKPIIKQEMDKITYDIQADPESKGSSVLDMMRKVPYLSVDGDQNILLNGSRGYRVFINGRPSALVERNPKDILRTMPASTIKSIEVITSPSAKYDGEGLAGIINIITFKQLANGYNGTVNLNYKGPVGGPAGGGSFIMKRNKWGISVAAGAGVANTPSQNAYTFRNTWGSHTTQLEQWNSRSADTWNHYVASEWSYELDSLNLVSAQINVSGNKAENEARQRADQKGGSTQSYALLNVGDATGNGLDAALNYQKGFKRSKEKLLTLSWRYLLNKNRDYNAIDIFDRLNFEVPDYNQGNRGRFSEQTVQMDYVQGFKTVVMEAGAKAIIRKNESDYQFHAFDNGSNDFKLDRTRSNQFTNDQNILALYNTYQYKVKDWGFKGGLRLEATNTDAQFISSNTKVEQHYLNLIPSAAIARKLNATSTLNLNYTNRIQRPSIYQLNPFVDRSNPKFESSGNPDLKTGFTNIIQVSYTGTKKGFLNVALAYMLFDDLLNQVSVYDAATGITRSRYENVGKARILKTNIFFNYPMGKDWTVRFNSDFRYIRARFLVGQDVVNNNGGAAYANLSTNYRFKSGWRINGDITVNSGGISGTQSRTNSFVASNLNLQKDFFKDRLTVTAVVANPLTKFRTIRDEVIGSDFTQEHRSDVYFRTFGVSANYRFGKLKESIRKNKRGIANDDVELK